MTNQIVVVGDVSLPDIAFSHIFDRVKNDLRQAGPVLCSLEGSISERGAPVAFKDATKVRSAPGFEHVLAEAGFRGAALANNHTMDFGPEALLDSIRRLSEAGIASAGAGPDLEAALAPATLQVDGKRVAFLSVSSVFWHEGFAAERATPGIATVEVKTEYRAPRRGQEMPGMPAEIVTTPEPVELARFLDRVRAARTDSDLVMVLWHWGLSQGSRAFVPYQQDLGRAAIDAGADLVVGQHSPDIQPVERYGGGLICYGLGDFAHLGRQHPPAESFGFALLAPPDRDLLDQAALQPVHITSSDGPIFAHGSRAQAIQAEMLGICEPFGMQLIPTGDGALTIGHGP